MEEQQPGQVIAPVASVPSSAVSQEAQAPTPAVPDIPPLSPAPQAFAPQPVAPTPYVVSTPAGASFQGSVPQEVYPENIPVDPVEAFAQQAPEDTSGATTWTAAEYIHHEKDSTWYGAFTLGAILLSAAIFFVTKDIISTAVIVVAIGVLAFISSRKPRQENYALNDDYIQIGPKEYMLQDFKAFSVDDQAPVLSVTLLPLKRLMPPITVYVDETHEQAVIDYLSDFLPMEPHKIDAIDRLLRRLHF